MLRDITGMYDLRGVNLSGVRFATSDLSQAQINDTTIFSSMGTDEYGQMRMLGVDLSGTNARIEMIYGSAVDFSGVNLSGVDFTGADLSAATFDENTVFGSTNSFTGKQEGVNLSGTNANLNGIVFTTAPDFRGANWEE